MAIVRLLADLLIATACLYVMAGTFYWYVTLKYDPAKWFFDPRTLRVIPTWPRDFYQKVRRRIEDKAKPAVK